MSQPQMTIDDYREFHADLISLAVQGLIYTFPSHDPLDPLVVVAPFCTAEQRTRAIPLDELEQIFLDSERAFQAAHN